MAYESFSGIMDGPVFDAYAALVKQQLPEAQPYVVGLAGRTGVWGSIAVLTEDDFRDVIYAQYFVQGDEAAAAWDAIDENPEGWLNGMLGATEFTWERVREEEG